VKLRTTVDRVTFSSIQPGGEIKKKDRGNSIIYQLTKIGAYDGN
jgi:hypothetical protein